MGGAASARRHRRYLASARTCFVRRLLWRAALLRWMMPLLTMLSITGVAAARAEAASSCLPAFSAKVALRMALRSCEVSASLPARCTVDCRAAFSADFVFAKRRLLERQGSKSDPKRAA